jgi:hypothetical protein
MNFRQPFRIRVEKSLDADMDPARQAVGFRP